MAWHPLEVGLCVLCVLVTTRVKLIVDGMVEKFMLMCVLFIYVKSSNDDSILASTIAMTFASACFSPLDISVVPH